MTTTLLRHEFLRTKGMLGVITGIVALLVVVGSLLALTPFGAAQALGMVIAVVSLGAYIPVLLIAMAVDYWRSAYGRTGYFVHGIPLTGGRIYGARLLYGAGVVVAGYVVAGLLALLPALVAASHQRPAGTGAFTYLATAVRDVLQTVTPMTWVALVVAVLLLTWSYLVQYYFAASIGSGPRWSSLGAFGPVVVWIALYLVMQAVMIASVFTLPLGISVDGGALHLVGVDYLAAAMSGAEPNALPGGMIVAVLLATAVFTVWTARSWNRVSLR